MTLTPGSGGVPYSLLEIFMAGNYGVGRGFHTQYPNEISEQKGESLNTIQDVANDSPTMSTIANSSNILSDSERSLVVMDSYLSNKVALSELGYSSTGNSWVRSTPFMFNTESNSVDNSTSAQGSFIAGAGGLDGSTFADIGAVVSDVGAMNSVGASSLARSNIRTFTDSYNALVNEGNMAVAKYAAGEGGATPSNFDTMSQLANSPSAMSGVAGSNNARDPILASQTAMNAINSVNDAIVKMVTIPAGLNASNYSNMDAVAGNSSAMQSISNTQNSLDVIKKSPISVDAILNSQTAIDELQSVWETDFFAGGTITYTSPPVHDLAPSDGSIENKTDVTVTANASLAGGGGGGGGYAFNNVSGSGGQDGGATNALSSTSWGGGGGGGGGTSGNSGSNGANAGNGQGGNGGNGANSAYAPGGDGGDGDLMSVNGSIGASSNVSVSVGAGGQAGQDADGDTSANDGQNGWATITLDNL